MPQHSRIFHPELLLKKKNHQNHWQTPVLGKLAMETHRKEEKKRSLRLQVLCYLLYSISLKVQRHHQYSPELYCNRYIILRVKMCCFNEARRNTNLEEERKEFKKM